LGLVEYRFDQNGQYREEYDDGKEEITGAVYNYEDEKQGDIIQTFTFNELEEGDFEAFSIANALLAENLPSGLYIDLNFENRVNDLAMAGLSGNTDKGILGVGKYIYAFFESLTNGNMDYYSSHLNDNYAFYLSNNTAYNPMDAGNYLWGVGIAKLGIPAWDAYRGSQINAVLLGNRQNGKAGINLKGDSEADQRAIFNGYFWEKK
jgi:hypothetical protein